MAGVIILMISNKTSYSKHKQNNILLAAHPSKMGDSTPQPKTKKK